MNAPVIASISPLPDNSSSLIHGVVLTGPGGQFEVPQDLRQLLALTGDHKLYISTQHQADPYVMAFLDRLDLAQYEYHVVTCSMTKIKSIYQQSDVRPMKAQVDTDRQAQALGIIATARKQGASDIHIIVGHDITRILYRIHGLLWEVAQEKSQVGRELCAALYNSMCDVSRDYFQPHIPQDARVGREFVEQLGLFGARVATRPLVDGPLMIMRLLYDDHDRMTLEDLGFMPEQIAQFARLRSLPYGINLITGPTGSGKSKSLQVNMNLLHDESNGTRHILTIEDPPEYPLKANQSPLAPGESWSGGITNTVRLDPDVLMYGELRDLESVQGAFSGGMTGHQVWSTLHTNNAIASIQRLMDMGVPQYLVTDPALLTGIINQSLLPVLCPNCSVPAKEHTHELDPSLVRRLENLELMAGARLRGNGCSHCLQLGVVNRTVVAEVLLTNAAFMAVFSRDGASAARRYWIHEMGGVTKVAHASLKISQGQIDPRQAEKIIGPLDLDKQMTELTNAQ